MNTWQLGDWVILQPIWLLPALLLLIASFVWRRRRSSSDWRDVLSPAMFDYLGAGSQSKPRWNLPLLIAAIAAASLSQFALRQSDDETWRHSTGWVVVADVSRSMTLNDTVPSRLAAMRESLAVLSREAAARPIALVLFAGDAFLVAPPAFDRSVFDEHAALLEHGVIPVEGSNLTRALSLAASIIEDSQFLQARVFVLGDSGGVGNSSLAAARFLGDAGHRIDMLVFGSSSDAVLASTTESAANGIGDSWSQLPAGADEISVQWESVLALAKAGRGRAVRANSFGVIDYGPLTLNRQSSASTHDGLKTLVWREQSHWLLLAGIPLMLLLFRQEGAR